MITIFHNLRTSLDAVTPGFFNALLAALVFIILWGVRQFKPLIFMKMPPALQAWPALVISAVLAALTASAGKDVGASIVNVLGQSLSGLVSGILAVGVHRTLKESPLPYGVNQIPPKMSDRPQPPTPPIPPPPPSAVAIIFLVGICGWFSVVLVACASMTAREKAATEKAACILLEGIDPALGSACVTAEELLPLVPHLNGARRYKKTRYGAAASGVALDPCKVPEGN